MQNKRNYETISFFGQKQLINTFFSCWNLIAEYFHNSLSCFPHNEDKYVIPCNNAL